MAMSKAAEFAKLLKDRAEAKKPGSRKRPKSVPCYAPEPEPPSSGKPVAAGVSKLLRLKAELRAMRDRAEKAEAALAAVEKVKATNTRVFRLNQEIARLRADRPLKLRRARQRIAELEAENARLRERLRKCR
jgi:hypothetical protein